MGGGSGGGGAFFASSNDRMPNVDMLLTDGRGVLLGEPSLEPEIERFVRGIDPEIDSVFGVGASAHTVEVVAQVPGTVIGLVLLQEDGGAK